MPIKNSIDGSSVNSFYAYYDKNKNQFRETTSNKLGGNSYLETNDGEVVYINSEGRIRTASIAAAYDESKQQIFQSSHELLNKLKNPSLRERTIASHEPVIHRNSLARTDPYQKPAHKPEVLTKQFSDPAFPASTRHDFTGEVKDKLDTPSSVLVNQPQESDDDEQLTLLASTVAPSVISTSASQSLLTTSSLMSAPLPISTNPSPSLRIVTDDSQVTQPASTDKPPASPLQVVTQPVVTTTTSAEDIRAEREAITKNTITFPDSPSKSEELKNAESEFQRQVNILMAAENCKTPEEEAARRPLVYGVLVAESSGVDWLRDDYGKLDFDHLTIDVTKLSTSEKNPDNKDIGRRFHSAKRRLAAHIDKPQEPEDRTTVRVRRLNEERKLIQTFCKRQNLNASDLAEQLSQSGQKNRINDLVFKSNSVMNSGLKPKSPEEHSQKLDEDMMLIQALSDQLKSEYPGTYKFRNDKIDHVPYVSVASNKVWDILKEMTVEGTEEFRFTEQEADDYRRYVLSLVPHQEYSQSTSPANTQDLSELKEVGKFDNYEERLIRQQRMTERMKKRAEERKRQMDALRNKK